ncbi:MAG TPA: PQQ-dependent sugar dehydrogenase, partial [Candidatus Limnocylindria bacterium]
MASALAALLALPLAPVAAVERAPGTPSPAVDARRTDPVTDAPPRPDASLAGFTDELVVGGFTNPTTIAFAPDGRIFVGEKRGRVYVLDGPEDTTPALWANVSINVHDYWDRGMIGLALDPAFATNGRLYVAYTHDALIGGTAPRWGDTCPTPPGSTSDGCVVSGRLSVLTSTGPGTAAEQVLIEDWCQQYPSHSMDDLVFGPDGALYLSAGDGASFVFTDYGQEGDPVNPCGDPPSGVGGTQTLPTAEGGALRSQDIRTTGDPTGLGGTVIRVDPATGAALPSNPLFYRTDPNARRIIAYGLRNPFRMAFHPTTGELWIGDVGWSEWEEINRHGDPDGAVRNYGWPCTENADVPGSYGNANLCATLTGSSAPVWAYDHDEETVVADGCGNTGGSISGLAFAEPGFYPTTYDRALFFSDYSRDCLWVMRDADANGSPDPATVAHVMQLSNPVQLVNGPDGAIWYVDFNGSLHRIGWSSNDPPTAVLDASPTSGPAPLTVAFDATGSSDPDGDPLTYAWDLDGDGAYDDGTGATAGRTYDDPGTITVRLRVADGHGGTGTDSVVIEAGNTAPVAEIDEPTEALAWSVGDTVTFSGTGTDAEDGTLPASSMSWELVLFHCPGACHEHPLQSWSGVAGGTFPTVDHDYPAHLELRLTVEDAHGSEATDTVVLDPATVDITVQTSPAGLSATAGTSTGAAPMTITAIHDGAVGIGVDTLQVVGGVAWQFTGWSDGGGATHTVTATTNATYTATFAAGFVDVPATSTYFDDVLWLADEGITTGCATDPPAFCPTASVTRAQMAAFLARALDLPPSGTDAFTDDNGTTHEAAINAVAAAGIASGCAPGRFCPTAAVTRAQMAAFLARALDLPPSGTDAFTDDNGTTHEA